MAEMLPAQPNVIRGLRGCNLFKSKINLHSGANTRRN